MPQTPPDAVSIAQKPRDVTHARGAPAPAARKAEESANLAAMKPRAPLLTVLLSRDAPGRRLPSQPFERKFAPPRRAGPSAQCLRCPAGRREYRTRHRGFRSKRNSGDWTLKDA